jgi:beta-aspartyl-peptidase (threonine type)
MKNCALRNCTRFITCSAVLGLVLAGVLAPRAEPREDPSRSREAVRLLLDDQVKAWNNGDLAGFLSGYWRSDDLTFYSGKDINRGWEATRTRYQKRYQAEGKEMGRLTFRDLDIEVLTPEVAWVRGRWQVVTSKETLGGLFTLLVKKLPEGWRIVHDHTSG